MAVGNGGNGGNGGNDNGDCGNNDGGSGNGDNGDNGDGDEPLRRASLAAQRSELHCPTLKRMMFVPSLIRSPSFRGVAVSTGWPFSRVPSRLRLSSSTNWPSGRRMIRACSASRSRPG